MVLQSETLYRKVFPVQPSGEAVLLFATRPYGSLFAHHLPEYLPAAMQQLIGQKADT